MAQWPEALPSAAWRRKLVRLGLNVMPTPLTGPTVEGVALAEAAPLGCSAVGASGVVG